MKFIRHTATSFAIALTLIACSDSGTTIGQPGSSNPPGPNSETRGLHVIGSKDEFSQSIREALLNQHRGNDEGGLTDFGTVFPDQQTQNAPPVVATESDSASSAPASTDVTGTNVQEVGVDEADRVKSDGRYLYVLNSTYSTTGPFPIDTVPVAEPDVAATSIAPFFPPSQTQIRILSLDAEAATSNLVKELTIDTGNEQAGGLYLAGNSGSNTLIATSSSLGGYWGFWDTPTRFMGQKSTIHKIDTSDPANASVTDSLKIEGQIVSSRRVGGYLYITSRFYPRVPSIETVTDAGSLEETINNADIEDLLPRATRASDGVIQALADANNCFVTQKPESGYYSPDIITLAVVDIASLDITDSKCFLGATETLYASTKAIYLATTRYDYPVFVTDSVGVSTPVDTDIAVIPEYDPRVDTDIHQFTINDGQLSYVGSGSVEGHLGWNDLQKPFRMSEKDGYLRVATYNETQNGNESPVFVSVLAPAGNNQLTIVSKLPNDANPDHIGKPREQLHASRFLGDKAYLVTFRQTDPLYVVDLSDPRNPVLAGELEIEGYSDYLHPIGENYLLGIGKGAIAAGSNTSESERGAFAQGVKVSLFDVSNPAAPTEIQSLEIGKRGTQSAALRDHHGITVQVASDTRPTRVTFGIDVHENANEYSSGPSGWYDWTNTGLFAFEVQTGTNAGITTHGSMIVESRSDQQPWGPTRGNDRSVIVNDAVFYIHGEQVYGANWNSLGAIDGPR